MILFKDIISELRRNPELNPKISALDALNKYKDDPSYFITFTTIEKVGLNPRSPFSTPVGLYAYKLKDVYGELESKNYLFGVDRPFVNVIQLTTDRVLDLENYNNKSSDLQKLRKIYESETGKSFDDVLKEFDSNNHLLYPVDTDGKYVYGLMNFISNGVEGRTGPVKKSMVYFNKLLRKMGYDVVIDRTGTVHLLQPSQAVFLVPSSYKFVEKIINKSYSGNEPVSANTYWHVGVNPTVDNVILKREGDTYKVLLIKRKNKVEFGKWALPGGFIDTNAKKGEPWQPGRETPRQAAIRELHEETGLYIESISNLLKQIGVYEGNHRDPRDTKTSWSKSHAFGLVLPDGFNTSSVKARDDASDAQWFDIKALPTLAFDHSTIIGDALPKLI